MTEKTSAIEHLRQLREKLVERRRRIAADAAGSPILSGDMAAAFMAVQEQIDAVDRAMKDEAAASAAFSAASAIG